MKCLNKFPTADNYDVKILKTRQSSINNYHFLPLGTPVHAQVKAHQGTNILPATHIHSIKVYTYKVHSAVLVDIDESNTWQQNTHVMTPQSWSYTCGQCVQSFIILYYNCWVGWGVVTCKIINRVLYANVNTWEKYHP